MPRKVSCGARSVCFLLPQYRGRDVSQMRNTHGISKALQYLKTHPRRLASQDSGKVSALSSVTKNGRKDEWRGGRLAHSSLRPSAGEELLLKKDGLRGGQERLQWIEPRERNPRDELKALGARTARKEVNVRAGSVPNGREGEVTRRGWRRERAQRRCGHRRDRRSGRSCTCRCRPSRRRRTGWGRFRCCC